MLSVWLLIIDLRVINYLENKIELVIYVKCLVICGLTSDMCIIMGKMLDTLNAEASIENKMQKYCIITVEMNIYPHQKLIYHCS